MGCCSARPTRSRRRSGWAAASATPSSPTARAPHGWSRTCRPSPTTSTPPTTWRPSMISAEPVAGLPEIAPGDDLAALIAPHVRDGDVVVVAHKIVSKAEGRLVALAGVAPSAEAERLGAEH